MERWRVGRKLGRTLYLDDQCVGMVDTSAIAAEIVTRMNDTGERSKRGLPCATCMGARVLCFKNMHAVPCQTPGNEHQCANTGHHTCPDCY